MALAAWRRSEGVPLRKREKSTSCGVIRRFHLRERGRGLLE
jgi:hypothetical protein